MKGHAVHDGGHGVLAYPIIDTNRPAGTVRLEIAHVRALLVKLEPCQIG